MRDAVAILPSVVAETGRMPPPLPAPPYKPEPYECCGRGCAPCIFDYYQDALDRYEAALRAAGQDVPAQTAAHPCQPR